MKLKIFPNQNLVYEVFFAMKKSFFRFCVFYNEKSMSKLSEETQIFTTKRTANTSQRREPHYFQIEKKASKATF